VIEGRGTAIGAKTLSGYPGIIIANAMFLGFMALFGLTHDILSYWSGEGRFEAFLFGDPRAIGFVEAHGLAGAIAVAALVHARSNPIFWHVFLGLVHTFLATCNLIFFDGFVATGETRLAIMVTTAHYALTALHAVLIVNTVQLGLRPGPKGSAT